MKSEKSEIASSFVTVLQDASTGKYASSPIPSGYDNAAEVLVDKLWSANEDLRADIFKEMNERLFTSTLRLFSERMSIFGVRSLSESKLKSGLRALCLCVMQEDDLREILPILSLHYHSASAMGRDPDRLFEEVAEESEECEKVLKSFLQRGEEDKSIEAMGYRAVESEEGFLYEREW